MTAIFNPKYKWMWTVEGLIWVECSPSIPGAVLGLIRLASILHTLVESVTGFLKLSHLNNYPTRACVRNLDLWMQILLLAGRGREAKPGIKKGHSMEKIEHLSKLIVFMKH